MASARAALLLALLAAWEFLPRSGLMNPELLPPLSEVLTTLWKLLQRSNVHDAIGVTMAEVAVAFLVAIPLGTLLGVLIAEKPYLADIFKPLLFYVFSIPKSVFLPMFILVFGINFAQKVAYAAFTTTFVVIMSAAACVESVKTEYIEVARSCGASRTQLILRVYVPSMLPMLLETIRISMIFNFTAVMIAEMYASLFFSMSRFDGWRNDAATGEPRRRFTRSTQGDRGEPAKSRLCRHSRRGPGPGGHLIAG